MRQMGTFQVQKDSKFVHSNKAHTQTHTGRKRESRRRQNTFLDDMDQTCEILVHSNRFKVTDFGNETILWPRK
jgi:hypothetical protein